MDSVKWSDMAFDLTTPCADCPFRKETPVEMMGEAETLGFIFLELAKGPGNLALHSCHKTDPRVTDGGYNPEHKGKVQHCGGLLALMQKWNRCSDYFWAAAFEGKLDVKKLRRSLDLVPTRQEFSAKLQKFCKENEVKNAT